MIKKLLILGLSLSLLTSCIRMPVENSTTLDNTAELTFSFPHQKNFSNFRVIVDGIDMGKAKTFTNTDRSLSIISGVHIIEIFNNDQLIYSEKVFLGDRVTKNIIVK